MAPHADTASLPADAVPTRETDAGGGFGLQGSHAPVHETIGRINWVGLRTLYLKEVRRYLNVWQQTLAAPVVTTLLFYVIFAIAFGGLDKMIGAVPFMTFLAPGLIMMGMAQNAFANTSSSLTISKIQGNIVDVLMPPLSPAELALGFVGGGVTRGLMVGLVTGGVMVAATDLSIANPALILAHALLGSMMLSLMGVMGGIWADKFDHIAAVTNFVVTPLTFLSGTFFNLEKLPGVWQVIAQLNPFFYMIDGFRAGFIGQSDSNIWVGLLVMIAVNAVLGFFTYRMFRTGYNIKP